MHPYPGSRVPGVQGWSGPAFSLGPVIQAGLFIYMDMVLLHACELVNGCNFGDLREFLTKILYDPLVVSNDPQAFLRYLIQGGKIGEVMAIGTCL